MGRLRVEIDNDNPSESNDISGTYNRETDYRYFGQDEFINYPDGSQETIIRNLDGTISADRGGAVTPAYYSYGTISTAGTDAQGNPDPNVTAGSTWTQVQTDISSNPYHVSTIYTNSLGEPYLTQTSIDPPPGQTNIVTTDSVTNFDANGRPISSQGFDGSTTYTIYDPLTGQVGAQFVDAAGSGNYDPTKDPKSVTHFVEQTGSNNALTTINAAAGAVPASPPPPASKPTRSPPPASKSSASAGRQRRPGNGRRDG